MLPEVKNTKNIKSLIGYGFIVLDTDDELWLRTCAECGIDAKIKKTYKKDKFPYTVRFLYIKKKDIDTFRKVADSVFNKMKLIGHPSYDEDCTEFLKLFAS